MKKRLLLIVCLITIFTGTTLGIFFNTPTPSNSLNNTPATDSSLNISVLNVGQGLSILVSCDNHYLLYDGGDAGHSSYVVSYLLSQNISKLDYIIASHYDADHISGLVGVLYNLPAGTIIAPRYTTDSHIYNSFVTAIASCNNSITYPLPGDTYSLGNAAIKILAPSDDNYDNENDYSVVVKISLNDKSILITGDATTLSEHEMISAGYDLNSDILVIGHHGSASSTSPEFLEAVNPSYAIISCKKNNSYGHPTNEVLEQLNAKNISIYRTDLSGTLNISIQNNTISLNASEPETGNFSTLQNTKYFFNTNTKKIHLPDCDHVSDISDKNKLPTGKALNTLLDEGYTPCKNCNPHLADTY